MRQYIELQSYIEQAQIAILEDPSIKALNAMKVDIINCETSPIMIMGSNGFDLIRPQNPLIKQLDSDIEAIQRLIIHRYKRIAREAGVDVR